MKKITFLMVLVALGATTLSCNDQDFSDVEHAIHEDASYNIGGDKEDIIDKPGN